MTKNYEEQVEVLLKELTLEEKIGMIHGAGFFRTKGVERLGIPPLVSSDGPSGVRMEFPNDNWLPIGKSDDYVSCNPSNAALAATWNPERAHESGIELGEEARGRGKDVILAPGINIKRDPRCGRNYEYMSEDPYLVETIAVPFIKGVQECDVAACVKHFAVNNQETDRLAVDTLVDERTMREIYLPGFQAAVQEGGSYTLMNAYNKFDGFFCSENKRLLNEILRDEWKYDGTVISDWGSVHSTKEAAESSLDVEMSIFPEFDDYYFADPLLTAVKTGEVSEERIDEKVRNVLRLMFRLKMIGEEATDRKQGSFDTREHQMSTLQTARESIVLLKNETMSTSDGDGRRILPVTQDRLNLVPMITGKERAESGKAAEGGKTTEDGECGKTVPVPGCRKRKVAVIGHNAVCCHAAGGGSGEVKALYEVSPLLGLKKALGGNVEVNFSEGYYVAGKREVLINSWQETSLEQEVMREGGPESEEQRAMREEFLKKRAELKEEACALAREADEVIYVGGLDHDYDTEGRDRDNLKLPYAQDELIEALLEIAPDMVVVLIGGAPVEMPWRDRARALVWSYYAGMEAGDALADVLLGRVNPSGKLPETFPAVYEDTVTYKNGQFGIKDRVEYLEGIFVGYRYYEKERIKPAFPFGYGLSYTEFSMDDLQVRTVTDGATKAGNTAGITGRVEDAHRNDEVVVLSVNVTNTGKLPGAEVVQCYVSDPECSAPRPVKELKAYRKVFLQPGESETVMLTLPRRAFTFYDAEQKAFVVEPGKFLLQVGNASDNCLLQKEIEL